MTSTLIHLRPPGDRLEPTLLLAQYRHVIGPKPVGHSPTLDKVSGHSKVRSSSLPTATHSWRTDGGSSGDPRLRHLRSPTALMGRAALHLPHDGFMLED